LDDSAPRETRSGRPDNVFIVTYAYARDEDGDVLCRYDPETLRTDVQWPDGSWHNATRLVNPLVGSLTPLMVEQAQAQALSVGALA
jgi:hypothetical protein